METALAGGVFLAALGVRIAVWLAWKDDPLANHPLIDAKFYHDLASGESLAPGGPLRWNPLVPAFLKGVYGLAGSARPPVALLVQAGLGALGAEFAYLTARRWFRSRAPALVCAALAALYAPFLVFEGVLLGAALAVFLTWVVLWLASTAGRVRSPLVWALPGAVLGAAGLAEPTLLAAAVPLTVWLALRKDGRETPGIRGEVGSGPLPEPDPSTPAPSSHPAGAPSPPPGSAPRPVGSGRLLRPASLLLGAAAALFPAFLTNATEGVYSPLPCHGGINFYIGNRPGASGRYEKAFAGPHGLLRQREMVLEEAQAREGRPLTWAEADAYWMRRGLEAASSDLAGWALLLGRKALLLLNASEIALDYNPDFLRGRMFPLSLPLPGFGLVFPLAAAGLVFLLLERKVPWAAVLLLAGGGAAVVLFFVAARYRLPLVPPLILFAGYGAAQSVRFAASARLVGLSLAAAAAALAAFVAFLPVEPQDFAVSWWMLGDAQVKEGRLFDALESYDRSLATRPTSAAWNNKGTALLRLSRAGEAAGAFRKAVDLEAGNREAWNNLGVAWKRKGDSFDEAEEAFLQALKRFPDYRLPAENLADLYEKEGLHDAAEQVREDYLRPEER